MKATYTKETSDYQLARIEALEKMVKIQEDFIQSQAERIDELQFNYADAKARYNMLKRNIELIDNI